MAEENSTSYFCDIDSVKCGHRNNYTCHQYKPKTDNETSFFYTIPDSMAMFMARNWFSYSEVKSNNMFKFVKLMFKYVLIQFPYKKKTQD